MNMVSDTGDPLEQFNFMSLRFSVLLDSLESCWNSWNLAACAALLGSDERSSAELSLVTCWVTLGRILPYGPMALCVEWGWNDPSLSEVGAYPGGLSSIVLQIAVPWKVKASEMTAQFVIIVHWTRGLEELIMPSTCKASYKSFWVVLTHSSVGRIRYPSSFCK